MDNLDLALVNCRNSVQYVTELIALVLDFKAMFDDSTDLNN